MSEPTTAQKRKCAEREVALRKSAYPRFVANKRMKQEVAEHEIWVMEAIADDYRRLERIEE